MTAGAMLKKTIVFTIELADRELFAKSLLALEMAKAGFRVYIGTFRSIHENRKHFKSCIFFHKSSYVRRIRQYKREMGATVAIMDEETGIAVPAVRMEDFCRERYGGLTPDCYNYVFTVGEAYRERLSRLKNLKGIRVVSSGWPRIDLWREDYAYLHRQKMDEIRERHGDYVLFVSSFGFTSRQGFEFKLGRAVSESRVRMLKNTFQALDNYIGLIRHIADEVGMKVVVRPHTSESIEEWRSIFYGSPNIVVVREGDVTPWLLAAQGVITYRSTVTVQAALNGIPTVQYKINEIDGIADVPVFKVSHCVDTYTEVVDYLCRFKLAGARDELKQHAAEVLAGDVSSLTGATAASRIARELARVELEPRPAISVGPLARAAFHIWDRYKYAEHLLRKQLFKKRAAYRPSRYDKVPNGIRAAEILSIVSRLAEGDPLLRGREIVCRQASTNLVILEMAE